MGEMYISSDEIKKLSALHVKTHKGADGMYVDAGECQIERVAWPCLTARLAAKINELQRHSDAYTASLYDDPFPHKRYRGC